MMIPFSLAQLGSGENPNTAIGMLMGKPDMRHRANEARVLLFDTPQPRMSGPDTPSTKRRRRLTRQSPFSVSHCFSFPVAVSLWYGKPEQAISLFHESDVKVMKRTINLFPGLAGVRLFMRHNTDIIGHPPSPGSDGRTDHPWGFLTFGLVKRDSDIKSV